MNRNIITILLSLAFLLLAAGAMAQDEPVCTPGDGLGQGNGVCQFIDEDGDGFNDLAPDADGDGIPNGLDDDYVRPRDADGKSMDDASGSLFQYKNMFGKLADVMGHFALKSGSENGHMYGPGDCTGIGEGPADGSGFGPGSADGGNGQGSAGEMPGGSGGAGGFGGNGGNGGSGSGQGCQ